MDLRHKTSPSFCPHPQRYAAIEAGARQEVARSRQEARELLAQTQLDAAQAVRVAAEGAERQLNDVRRLAAHQLFDARRNVPAMLAEIRAEARQSLQSARAGIRTNQAYVLDRATADLRFVADATNRAFEDVAARSRQAVASAKTDTQALMREIAGQGPEKTLSRGFALVRDADGNAITSATSTEAQITIQFRDGVRPAKLQEDNQP